MKHVLIVGGTGMLTGVTQALLGQGVPVTLCARQPERFSATENNRSRLQPVSVDYHNLKAFIASVENSTNSGGPFDLVVCWIHDSAPAAPLALARCTAFLKGARFIHVVGSAADDPSADTAKKFSELRSLPHIQYSQVILGFIHEHGQSRWLSNQEISDGVLAAIRMPVERTVVGTTRPWSRRP